MDKSKYGDELYSFQCKECMFIFLEPFNPSDRFAKNPKCPDCGGDSESYEGDLSDKLKKAVDEYNLENGINEI